MPNHIIASKNFGGALREFAPALEGRTMLVKKTEPAPVECVVRGYISGSGWKDYQKTGGICGIPLACGLERIGQAARADLHALHEGDDRDTMKTFHSTRR